MLSNTLQYDVCKYDEYNESHRQPVCLQTKAISQLACQQCSKFSLKYWFKNGNSSIISGILAKFQIYHQVLCAFRQSI